MTRRPRSPRYKRLIALLLPISAVLPGFSQWTALNCPVEYDIQTISVSADGRLICAGADWAQSFDGGDTWLPYAPHDDQNNPLIAGYNDLVRLNGDTMVAAGSWGSLDQYVIFRTTNDGSFWTPTYVDNTGAWPLIFEDIDFPTPLVGYACGTNGRVRKTIDGGATWNPMGNYPNLHLENIGFWSTNTGTVLSANKSYRTTNGNTWGLGVDLGTGYHGLHLLPSCTAVAAGDGEIAITTNCAQSWTNVDGPWITANDVFAFDLDTIIVATNDGLYVTHDGGMLWEQFPQFAGMAVTEITFLDGQLGYATVGTEVYRTTNGGGAFGPVAEGSVVPWPSECGERLVNLHSTSEADLTLAWYYEGAFIGDQVTMNYPLTDPVNTGTFILVVSNGQNTDTATWADTILVDQPFTVDAGPDLNLCPGDTGQLQANGGTNYQWAPWPGVGPDDVANPLVVNYGTYVITSTSGACTSVDTVAVIPPTAEDPWTWTELISLNEQVPINHIMPFSAATVALTSYPYDSYDLTFDAGVTIESQPTPLEVSALRMLDPFVGYGWNGARLLKTTDGWGTCLVVLPDSGQMASPQAYFRTQDDGVAMVVSDYYNVSTLITHDGGASWERHPGPDGLGPSPEGFLISSLDTCFVFDDYGQSIWVTHDGGSTWALSSLQLPLQYTGIESIAYDGHGVIFLLPSIDGLDADIVYTSMDGGMTWTGTPLLSDGNGAQLFSPGRDSCYAWSASLRQATVDGGECWGALPAGWYGGPNTLSAFAYSTDSILFRLRRNQTYGAVDREDLSGSVPQLGFEINENSLCYGLPLQLWSTSYGFDDYQWSVDGVVASGSLVPPDTILGVGAHTIELVGSGQNGTQNVVQTIEIHPAPTEAPEVFPIGLNCEHGDSMLVYTPGVEGAVGYQWAAGAEAWVSPSDRNDTIRLHQRGDNVIFFLPDYFSVVAAAVNEFGCLGPWSDSLIVPYATPIETNAPEGPISICLDPGVPTVATYTVEPTPGAFGYTWWVEFCDGSCDLVANGTSAQVSWHEPVPLDFCRVKVAAMDTCGAGEVKQITVGFFYLSFEVLEQPVDAIADEGDAQAVFSFDLSAGSSIVWYHNGVPVPNGNDETLIIAPVSLADAGAYWATATVQGCDGPLIWHSDTAQLTVIPDPLPHSQFTGPTETCTNDPVQFFDSSTGSPTAWDWTFQAGTPPTSQAQNPTVTYATPGIFTITLQASNTQGSGTENAHLMTVSECTGISEATSGGASVFPNPTSGSLRTKGLAPRTAFTIHDATGRLLLQDLTDEDGSISLSSLTPGHYTLTFPTTSGQLRFAVELIQ